MLESDRRTCGQFLDRQQSFGMAITKKKTMTQENDYFTLFWNSENNWD